ncbi:MAG TPA: uroporphyrinogen decarboxylase family protein [Kouleothrix sp.]|uniref:uroporphyrinogen decarboxylase family protein n=1 Tax=Kouleothrix sp. TaxID=2779161 RepID=UPI002B6DB417|nr:uroporphyrinogen decarboxylase family protein [Kouleothrix sp.]HRC75569.1 uroporphyrinogen decarboxylase family protein [Kouleothrix sp.]
MDAKQRVLATLAHQPTDRTPIDCWLYQKQFVEKLAAEYGPREQFLDEFNIDIFLGFVPWPNQYGRRFDVSELAEIALRDPRDAMWLEHTSWNDDFAGLNVRQAIEQQGGKRAIVAHMWGMVEGTSSFLGIENCWMNLGAEPERMIAWFDRYADWMCGLVDSVADAGVDMITLSDDWGSNGRMLFSPRMWRRMIAPYARRVVRHARARGLPVNLHSDGYIMDIMDDLVEIGYTSLHPLQESAGMDPRTIKERYGDKITIYGSLDVIDGLLAYEGEALDEYITQRFAIYAPGGGFIFNGGHFIQPDIPPLRLVRAYRLVNQLARQYGSST